MIPRIHGLQACATCQKLPRSDNRAEHYWDAPFVYGGTGLQPTFLSQYLGYGMGVEHAVDGAAGGDGPERNLSGTTAPAELI